MPQSIPDDPLAQPDKQPASKAEPDPQPAKSASETATLPPPSMGGAAATLAPTAAAGVGDRVAVPGYEILEELGRGGMGVVYKARHTRLGRLVALKMILSGAHAGAADLARFRTEAEAIARLQHPNIVQIHEVSEQGGLPYFSLEFCAGGSLEKKLNGTPLPPKQAAELIERLARAMQAAHAKGVIHRDLKPANVLLAEDGTPKITDFGLAKKLDDVSGQAQTQTNAIMGTPSYMAPEQAGGKNGTIGPAADVYALGAILYECLTGRPPFRAPTPLETLMQVMSNEPAAPRVLQPATPIDLETVCLKCLRKESAERYASAAVLADDLQRFLEGRPVEARPVGWVEKVVKWVRRNPALTASVASGLFALLVTVSFTVRAYHEENVRAAEKRQYAIDRALTAATGGNVEAAEPAIGEAERLGASTGQVRMLRGQVSMYRGMTRDAIQNLEQARDLLPSSVAARGMLAAAYAYDGQWDRFVTTLAEMEKLHPETPEDFLFKGYATANHNPGRGLEAIDEAIHRRPSMTVAFLLRAEVRAWQAQEADNPAQAEEAVKEATFAKRQLPDNPAALWVSLHANLIAAAAYQRRGQEKDRLDALGRAGKDADDLKGFTALPDAVVFRWLYFRELGKEYDLLYELQRASQETDHQYVTFYYALTLYRHGDFEKAAAALGEKQGCCIDCLRPFVLAEDQDPERGRILAKSAYYDLANRYHDGWTLMSAQTVLRLLGEKDEAIEACKKLKKTHLDWFPVLRPATKQFLDYNAGEPIADQMDRDTSASLWDQCDAHYFIAMTLLADGRRMEACDHFGTVLATRAYFFNAYDFSWVFLDRLKKDPHWPPWVRP